MCHPREGGDPGTTGALQSKLDSPTAWDKPLNRKISSAGMTQGPNKFHFLFFFARFDFWSSITVSANVLMSSNPKYTLANRM